MLEVVPPKTTHKTPSPGWWWLVVGCWWLVVGGWWLVVGGWWLVVGGWLLVVGGWWLVVGGWLLVVGCWWLVLGAWCLVLGAWCLVLGGWCLVDCSKMLCQLSAPWLRSASLRCPDFGTNEGAPPSKSSSKGGEVFWWLVLWKRCGWQV